MIPKRLPGRRTGTAPGRRSTSVPNWPPTLLMSGTRDMLLSDTVRMHRVLRKAGVAAELHICEASPHGGFMGSGAPEDMEMMAEFQNFIYSVWGV
jgi:epsilon-lactone hydrolase